MGTFSNVVDMKLAIDQLRASIEVNFRNVCKSAKDIADAFDTSVVAPLPTWNDVALPNEDEIPTMEDDTFIKMRKNMARQKDVIKRMIAAAALVRVVYSAIGDKNNRIESLKKRIDNGNADDAEVAVANSRIIYIRKIVVALRKRLNACITDFAAARHNALTAVCKATTMVESLYPDGDETLASLFSRTRADSKDAIRLIAESEDRIKSGRRVMHKGAAFGERAKK